MLEQCGTVRLLRAPHKMGRPVDLHGDLLPIELHERVDAVSGGLATELLAHICPERAQFLKIDVRVPSEIVGAQDFPLEAPRGP